MISYYFFKDFVIIGKQKDNKLLHQTLVNAWLMPGW